MFLQAQLNQGREGGGKLPFKSDGYNVVWL